MRDVNWDDDGREAATGQTGARVARDGQAICLVPRP
jgi:hypothetical protein